MPSYISSNANRFYTALESSYGSTPSPQAANRIPALKLTVRQQLEVSQRKDKTGSRTFPGLPVGGRRRTQFELQTYLTSWSKTAGGPGYGPLFQAAMGGASLLFSGAPIQSGNTTGALTFSAPHGLSAGQAISAGGEIRFAEAIVDPNTVQLNAPLTALPGAGALAAATMSYTLATQLPSVTIFDYWSPPTAIQRLLSGAAMNSLEILVNGDYHEFHFTGIAQDVVDSTSFSAGAAQLATFPTEPALEEFDYSIVPGNMGQAWLGTSPSQFLTITNAAIVLNNELDARAKEFGSTLPQAIAPGRRSVSAAFNLYGMDDGATQALYQAARQRSPISVMFQLGELPGQMMAVNLKSVIPEVPEFDDGDNRLQWKFRASRAQGSIDDELTVAFA